MWYLNTGMLELRQKALGMLSTMGAGLENEGVCFICSNMSRGRLLKHTYDYHVCHFCDSIVAYRVDIDVTFLSEYPAKRAALINLNQQIRAADILERRITQSAFVSGFAICSICDAYREGYYEYTPPYFIRFCISCDRCVQQRISELVYKYALMRLCTCSIGEQVHPDITEYLWTWVIFVIEHGWRFHNDI